MSVTNELIAFIYFSISGMICGFIFDLFRAKRKIFTTSNWLVYIEDLSFWLIVGAIALYTSYISSNGQVRVYMLIAMLMGMIIYFLTFSKLFYKVITNLCRYIKRLRDVLFRDKKTLI